MVHPRRDTRCSPAGRMAVYEVILFCTDADVPEHAVEYRKQTHRRHQLTGQEIQIFLWHSKLQVHHCYLEMHQKFDHSARQQPVKCVHPYRKGKFLVYKLSRTKSSCLTTERVTFKKLLV